MIYGYTPGASDHPSAREADTVSARGRVRLRSPRKGGKIYLSEREAPIEPPERGRNGLKPNLIGLGQYYFLELSVAWEEDPTDRPSDAVLWRQCAATVNDPPVSDRLVQSYEIRDPFVAWAGVGVN